MESGEGGRRRESGRGHMLAISASIVIHQHEQVSLVSSAERRVNQSKLEKANKMSERHEACHAL